MKIISLSLLSSLMLFSIPAHSQELIEGKIMAFKGYPVKNAIVTAKKSKATATTDVLGNFKIQAKSNDILKVKAAGFENGAIKCKGNKEVGLNMIYLNNDQSYEQVLKGNHIDKKSLDYCIENLLDENNNYDKMANIFQIIQQVYPPAKIEDLRGVTSVFLNSRGAQSISSDSNALLVVDGVVQQSISSIQPRQVKSVKVLVGLEASNYGTRGGNGVVEISLKND